VIAAELTGRLELIDALNSPSCRPLLSVGYDHSTVRLNVGPAAATGDIDCDGAVTVADLIAVLDSWGACLAEGCCLADCAPLGGDGVVDALDLAGVLAAFDVKER
jgi:hypothetical protein